MTAAALLEVDGVTVKYGALAAVSSVSLALERGSALVVLGANGAGKSSLARAICGLVPLAGGTIRFDGRDISGSPTNRVARLGVAYVPERGNVFPTLSVEDNMRLACRNVRREDRSAAMDRAFTAFPALAQRRRQVAASLSGGERQMLALGRALALRPSILIVDELSLGLAPKVIEEVFVRLEAIRDEVSIILIEQFVHRALRFGDQCVILKRGGVVWSGAAGDAHDQVLSTYLG